MEFELNKEPLFASLRGSLMYNSANNFWILESNLLPVDQKVIITQYLITQLSKATTEREIIIISILAEIVCSAFTGHSI